MDFHDHVKACKKSTQYKVPPNSPAKSYGVVASIGGEPCNCGMADAKVLPRGERSTELSKWWIKNFSQAAWAAEFLDMGDDPLPMTALQEMYRYCPIQTTIDTTVKDLDVPSLRLMSTISTRGTERLKPSYKHSNAARFLVLVTDSITCLRVSNKKYTDLSQDLAALKKPGDLLSYYSEVYYECLWGKSLPAITQRVQDKVAEIELTFGSSALNKGLLIDVMVIWAGNELTGEHGICVNPNVPEWLIKQRPDAGAAKGQWSQIADRVCRSISALASLKGRPNMGFVSLLGNVRHTVYSLDPKYGEANDLFFNYARSLGIRSFNFTPIIEGETLFDSYHLRDSSDVRQRLSNAIGRYVTLLVVDHMCSMIPKNELLRLAEEEPFQEKGLYVVGVEYDILVEELKKHNQARMPITNPDEVIRDPWDTEWPDTEVSVADTMAKVRVPREILELDASSMVPIGEGQHITRDEYVASRSLPAASSSTGEVATADAEAAIRSYLPYRAHDLPSKEGRQAAMEMTRKAREKQEAEYQLPEFWAGGWSTTDDMDYIDCIDESLGFSYPESYYPSPDDDRSTWIELTRDQLQKTYPDDIPHWIKTFISGLVRGAFQDPNDPRQPPRWARGHDLSLTFEGTWVNVQDVLNIVNRPS